MFLNLDLLVKVEITLVYPCSFQVNDLLTWSEQWNEG